MQDNSQQLVAQQARPDGQRSMPAAEWQPQANGLDAAAPAAAASANALVHGGAGQASQPQAGGQQAFGLLEKFLGRQSELQAVLLPSLPNVSTVHIQRDDVLNFIAVQQWVAARLGLQLPLLAGTVVSVASQDLTAQAQQQLLAGLPQDPLAPQQQQQQQQPCEAAVATAVPLRLRQVASVSVPAGAASAGQALVQLVGGGVVLAERLGSAALQDTPDSEALCCELAALQVAGVAPPLRLYDLAHTIWRLRLCALLEEDIKHANQEQAELASQGHDQELLDAAQETVQAMMRDRVRMLPKASSYVADIMSYVQLSATNDADQHQQQLDGLAAHWHSYVQHRLVAAQQPAQAPGSQQAGSGLSAPVLPPGLLPDAAAKPLYNSWNTAVPPGLDITLAQQQALATQPCAAAALSPQEAADADDLGFFEDPLTAGPGLSPLQAGDLGQGLKQSQGRLGFGIAGTRAGAGLSGRQQRSSSGAPGAFAAGMAWPQQQQQQQQQGEVEEDAPPALQALMSKYSGDMTALAKQGSGISNSGGGAAAGATAEAAGGGSEGGGADYMYWVKHGDIMAAQNDPRTRRAHALVQSRGSGSYSGSGDWGSRLHHAGSGLPRHHAEQQRPWNGRHDDSRRASGDGHGSHRSPPDQHHHYSSRRDGDRDRRSSDGGAAAAGSWRRSSDGAGRERSAATHHEGGSHSSQGRQSRERDSHGSPVRSPRTGDRRLSADAEAQQRAGRSGGSGDKSQRSRSSSRDRAANGRHQGSRRTSTRDDSRDRQRKRSRSRSRDRGERGRSRSPAELSKRPRPDSLQLPDERRAAASASPRSLARAASGGTGGGSAAATGPGSLASSPGPLSIDSALRRFQGRLEGLAGEGAADIFGALTAAQSAERATREWLRTLLQLQHSKAGTDDCVDGWFTLPTLRKVHPVPREVINAYGGDILDFFKCCPALLFRSNKPRMVTVREGVDIDTITLPASPSAAAAAAAEDDGAGWAADEAAEEAADGSQQEEEPADEEEAADEPRGPAGGASEVDHLLREYTSKLMRALSASSTGQLDLNRAAGLLQPELARHVRPDGDLDLPKLLADFVPQVQVLRVRGQLFVRRSHDGKTGYKRVCYYWDPVRWGRCFKAAGCDFKHLLYPGQHA